MNISIVGTYLKSCFDKSIKNLKDTLARDTYMFHVNLNLKF